MKNNETIDALNELLEINNDRREGYEKALKETDEQDLKSIFADFARTSSRCITELTDEIISLNGKPVEGTKVSGKFFRAWMDFKAALTGRDRKAIISSCEFGEDNAVATYEKVLKNETDHLSLMQQDMVRAQYALIKADHDKIRNLRDSASHRPGDTGTQRARASL
jgi:uncharacterized protein (TIGR02284 family)